MENFVKIEGRVEGLPSVYYAAGQFRVEATVYHTNPVTLNVHRFRVQLRGEKAQRFLTDMLPSSVIRFDARLKAGSNGRVRIIAHDYQSDGIKLIFDPVTIDGDSLSALLKAKALLCRHAEERNVLWMSQQTVRPVDTDDGSDASDAEDDSED